jgi:hypothetical protein
MSINEFGKDRVVEHANHLRYAAFFLFSSMHLRDVVQHLVG